MAISLSPISDQGPLRFQLDWYWLFPGIPQVFSSKRADLVPVTDNDYRAWCENYSNATMAEPADLLAYMEANINDKKNNPIVARLRQLAAAR